MVEIDYMAVKRLHEGIRVHESEVLENAGYFVSELNPANKDRMQWGDRLFPGVGQSGAGSGRPRPPCAARFEIQSPTNFNCGRSAKNLVQSSQSLAVIAFK
jgi:hypothetical protein